MLKVADGPAAISTVSLPQHKCEPQNVILSLTVSLPPAHIHLITYHHFHVKPVYVYRFYIKVELPKFEVVLRVAVGRWCHGQTAWRRVS